MPDRGSIQALWVSPEKGQPMRACSEVQVLANFGLKACAHGRPGGSRQVLLLESETLADLGLAPGLVKENITTAGIALHELRPGARLQLGSKVVLEVTRLCHPCRKMDHLRRGLSEDLQGRRGVLARVHTGGGLRVGDEITILAPALAEQPAA